LKVNRNVKLVDRTVELVVADVISLDDAC